MYDQRNLVYSHISNQLFISNILLLVRACVCPSVSMSEKLKFSELYIVHSNKHNFE